ncbi:MAG TPA: dipeptidase [Candidatus Limnocylindrales bacterium]|nr:dipeptidase [Candidatus Limnocylindrales bacterium]
MTQIEQARAYARANADRFRKQLLELIRIPSISTDPTHKGDMQRAAEFLQADLLHSGAARAEIMPTGGHPVVYAEWLGAGADAKTLLIYGHYDVQPAEMSDGWTSEPFEPVIRNGVIYARGSSDDKGQAFIHAKVFESMLLGGGGAPVNLKMLLEGEEEIGSKHLTTFIQANRELLKADAVLISDTGMIDIDQPAVTYGLRGLTYMQIDVQASAIDLHSGQFGGIVHNPALALAQIIAHLHNPDNSIAVPGFYDDIQTLSPAESEALKATDIPAERLMAETGIPAPWGEEGYTLRERVSTRPTLEINGLLSGFTGEGSKTVLPAKAMAKVSCRLVPDQNPTRIYELVRDYVASITPPGVKATVTLLNLGDAAVVDIESPAMKAVARAYERGWGKAPIYLREGGSIPVVADFRRELNAPVLLMGYGLNTDGAHGPDEHYSLAMFHQGIDTAILFLEEFSRTEE